MLISYSKIIKSILDLYCVTIDRQLEVVMIGLNVGLIHPLSPQLHVFVIFCEDGGHLRSAYLDQDHIWRLDVSIGVNTKLPSWDFITLS